MMGLLLVTLSAFLIVTAYRPLDEHVSNDMISRFKVCLSKNPLIENDVELIDSGENLNNLSESGRCWEECMYTQWNIFQDGKLNKTAIDELVDIIYDDESENEEAKEAYSSCIKAIGEVAKGDGCEFIRTLSDCLHNKNKYVSVQGFPLTRSQINTLIATK
ncbi:hypothetical protein O3M35_000361 [Rhynocoris fuscipes]|uniref:Uncharacterized protein n=1 Tax=Rhynocoris fuscipes TaxID=488301 RepID=A0AAW1DP55_9HEMI